MESRRKEIARKKEEGGGNNVNNKAKKKPARRVATGALKAATAIRFTRQNERTQAPKPQIK